VNDRKRLFYDIETSPLQVFTWQLGEVHIDYKSIIEDRAIICICWKWAGRGRVESLTWDKKQNDKAMLKEFISVLDSADESCGHNSDRFDLPWIRGRALYHDIPMQPDYATIDTLKLARKQFKLPSNRLDALGRQLLDDKKLPTGFGLWRDIVLYNDEKALKKMVAYCKQDVRLLERLFDKIMPYCAPSKVSVARFARDCPECASSRTQLNGILRTMSSVKQRIRCMDCGKSWAIAKSKADKNAERAA